MKWRALGIAGVLLFTVAVGGYALQRRGILFPEMKPVQGTYDAPAGEIGKPPTSPWSQTTIGAAVDGKPLPGRVVTVVGEIIDLSCYLQVGKHGQIHRDCGQKCLRNGMPIGLLAKDGSVYTLIEEEHDPRRDSATNFREVAIENMARVMKVTGTLTRVDGHKTIYVQGYTKQ